MFLNILQFLSISTQLALQAAKIINQVHLSKNIGKIMKGVDDPVTQADFKVQTLIINGLRTFWPHIKIVGEETSDYKGEINYDYSKLDKNIFNEQSLFNFNKKQEKIATDLELQNVCVWIDPLDGTLSYTKGQLNEVTTLVGLTYNKKARLGVIGIPYVLNNKQYQFKPKVLLANIENQKVFQFSQNGLRKIEPRLISQNFVLSTTKNKVSPQQFKFLKQISPRIVQSGGCGNKIGSLVYGEADCMIYLGSRTSKWDICAGEAILKAHGGNLCYLDGKEVVYDQKNKDYTNYGGVICSLDAITHEKIIHHTYNYKL